MNGRIHIQPQDPSAEELELHRIIAEHRSGFDAAIKPYLDRLTAIARNRPAPNVIVSYDARGVISISPCDDDDDDRDNDTLCPCRSAHCECESGRCSRQGYFDARGT